jgi:hypothetical protein
MSDWFAISADVNSILQNAFGEPVVYQPMQAGKPVGSPLTITVVRRLRERMEAGAVASMEEVEINPADLPNTPLRGDVVTAWESQFVVSTVRQPDPYGMVHVTLTLQPQQ